VYQVENLIIEKIENGDFDEIQEFIESAKEEELLIEVAPRHWIPDNDLEFGTENQSIDSGLAVEVHVEEGVDLPALLRTLRHHDLHKIVYYGPERPSLPEEFGKIKLEVRKKDFSQCQEMAIVDGDFNRFTHASYRFNRRYNSCWGYKIAITADENIRPCIHSRIIIATLNEIHTDPEEVLERMQQYWKLTKDKVRICKDCELRHICFDCREIAYRQNGELSDSNPLCVYNPYKGAWNNQSR